MTASYSFTVKEPRHDRLDPQRYPAAAVCVDLDAVRIGCLLSLWEGARSDWRAAPTLGVAPIRIAGRPRGRHRGNVRVADGRDRVADRDVDIVGSRTDVYAVWSDRGAARRVAGVIARCRPDLASREGPLDRKSTRLNSSHLVISY